MLQITDYHLLVLNAFASLKREINEAEQFTIQQYNQVMNQQKAAQEAQQKQTEEQTKVEASKKSKEEK